MALNPNQRRVSSSAPKAAAPVRKAPSGAHPPAGRPAAARKPAAVNVETPPSTPVLRSNGSVLKRPSGSMPRSSTAPAAPTINKRPSGPHKTARGITESDLETKDITPHDSSTVVAPPKIPAPVDEAPRVPKPARKALPRNEDLQPEIDEDDDLLDEHGESGQSSIDRAIAAAKTPFKPIAMGLAVGCIILLGLCTYLFTRAAPEGTNAASSGAPAHNGATDATSDSQNPGLSLVAKPKAPSKPVVNVLRQGATASGCENAAQLIDGNFLNYDGGSGFAFHDVNTPNAHMLITLHKPQRISCIRILLWDKDDRAYSYILEGSTDGKKFSTIVDNSRKDCQSWQEIEFAPMNLKAIRLRGTANNKNTQFHVVEVEAYDSPPKAPKLSPPRGGANELSCKPGIFAQYYEGTNHYATTADVPYFSRVEKTLGFGSIPGSQPGQGLQNWVLQGACAAVFSGFVKIDQDALYTFFIESDDGSRLYIDGEVVVDNDGQHGMTEIWGQVDLKPGLHRIWVEYFNGGGPMGLNVSIKPKGGDKRPLGPELFYNPAEAKQ